MTPDELRTALKSHAALHEHGDDIVLALTLAGRVVDVWTTGRRETLEADAVRAAWPELGEALDALTNGPEA